MLFRSICVNKSSNAVLNLLTDFSAVLDHDVQDKLNTAISCRFIQCILIHSPRFITLENNCQKGYKKSMFGTSGRHKGVCSRQTATTIVYVRDISLKNIQIFNLTESIYILMSARSSTNVNEMHTSLDHCQRLLVWL